MLTGKLIKNVTIKKCSIGTRNRYYWLGCQLILSFVLNGVEFPEVAVSAPIDDGEENFIIHPSVERYSVHFKPTQ